LPVVPPYNVASPAQCTTNGLWPANPQSAIPVAQSNPVKPSQTSSHQARVIFAQFSVACPVLRGTIPDIQS
jgi:hypothetical protein